MKLLNYLILSLSLLTQAPILVAQPLPAEPRQIASAKNQQAAHQFFSRYASLLRNYDPKIMDLYAENAKIHLSRHESNSDDSDALTKAEYREIFGFWLQSSQKKGWHFEPFEVSYQPSGNRVQISITWYARSANAGFSHVLIVGQNNRGRWMIFEEYL